MHLIDEVETGDYRWMNGDCVEAMSLVDSDSIGLQLFSPPFPGMYAYSDSERDIGNARNQEEMIDHFKFLIPELLRTLMPGRSCCVHLCQGVTFQGRHGHRGLKDFRGAVIDAMVDAGFVYYAEVCIEKCPQLRAIRSKDHSLMFKTLATDSAKLGMGLADYLLQFRKPGDNPAPIRAGISEKYGNSPSEGWITSEEWITWANPIWHRYTKERPDGIREMNVIQNYRDGRSEKDEKHLCPLQLDVIERCVKLWSNPGETVLSPFGGVASEGYGALKLRRKYVGIELNHKYWAVGLENLKEGVVARDSSDMPLFDCCEEEVNGAPDKIKEDQVEGVNK